MQDNWHLRPLARIHKYIRPQWTLLWWQLFVVGRLRGDRRFYDQRVVALQLRSHTVRVDSVRQQKQIARFVVLPVAVDSGVEDNARACTAAVRLHDEPVGVDVARVYETARHQQPLAETFLHLNTHQLLYGTPGHWGTRLGEFLNWQPFNIKGQQLPSRASSCGYGPGQVADKSIRGNIPPILTKLWN